MHPKLQLSHRQKAFLHREEGMFLVGMHCLAGLMCWLAFACCGFGGQREFNQIVVLSNSEMTDKFKFHLLGLLIIGPDLII
jgi:hypothetical protein